MNREMEEKVKLLLENGRRSEAIKILEDLLARNGEEEALLLQLGELLYAEGRMTEAMNRFNALLRLNPGQVKAKNYVLMIRNILDYYCKDLLNP